MNPTTDGLLNIFMKGNPVSDYASNAAVAQLLVLPVISLSSVSENFISLLNGVKMTRSGRI
jgi:hypothetical protein